MNKKQICITLITIVITTIIGTIGIKIANAYTIEKYEAQINDNNVKIEQIENIKTQLHITAEMFRSVEDINNGFDVELGKKWQKYSFI